MARREGGIWFARSQLPPPPTPRRTRLGRRDRRCIRIKAALAHASASCSSHLCVGVPQWRGGRAAPTAPGGWRTNVDGIDWYRPARRAPPAPRARVRLLAPFDPLVWDRRRFEHFWGWAYRFEAYAPPLKRILGYYALLLWRDAVIGWANATATGRRLPRSALRLRRRARRAPQRSARAGGGGRAAARVPAAALIRAGFGTDCPNGITAVAARQRAPRAPARRRHRQPAPPSCAIGPQPTGHLGDDLLPAAKMLVKAAMPARRRRRLCRTSAVVEATSGRIPH